MTDYFPLICRGVAALDTSSGETRRALYDRARVAQVDQLRKVDPSLTKSDFERERLSLEGAIRRVEIDAAIERALLPVASGLRAPIAAKLDNFKTPPEIRLTAGKTKKQLELPAGADANRKSIRGLRTVSFSKETDAAFLGAFVLLLLVIAPLTYMHGIVWLWSNILENVAWQVDVALAVCIIIIFPLSLFRATRIVSAYGFLISAFIFGVSTWMAGLVATYAYLGTSWTIIALFFLFVGVVPFGLIGAAINSDWFVIGFLAGGLVLTYGARAIGARVAAKAGDQLCN
jgi:hypothetical protein